MFDNNLKILLRTAHKRFLVFGLNVLGLSIGISCVIFITIYSIDELSFDKHFPNHDRIYRVGTEYQTNSSSDLSMAESFLGVAPTLKREFAEVEDAVRVSPYKGTITVQYKSSHDEIFETENTYQVDKEFFNIFKHSFIYGNETSLSKPNSIVVTKSLAKKLFGENSPLNKVVLIDNQTFGVTGVINDLPRNSDLYYEALLSHDFSPDDDDDWGNPFGFTYVLLNSSVNANKLESKFT
jgi:putative ABC transport system permease protein